MHILYTLHRERERKREREREELTRDVLINNFDFRDFNYGSVVFMQFPINLQGNFLDFPLSFRVTFARVTERSFPKKNINMKVIAQ